MAEEIALEYFIKSDYEILECNWRNKKAEIDLIVKKDNYLIFVEVKSRSSSFFGSPESAVTLKKKRMVVAGATSYMDQTDYNGLIRFDILSIILRSKDDFDLEHYVDAFFPGL